MKKLGILVLLVLLVSIGLVFAGGPSSSGSGSGTQVRGCSQNNRCTNEEGKTYINCGEARCSVQTCPPGGGFTASCSCPR